MINTPFNYTGSKLNLLDQILPKFDYDKQNFIDVFCGGGSVYVNCIDKYDSILINDIIGDLIEIHRNIIFDDYRFINDVQKIIPTSNESEKYLILREDYNKNKSPEKLFALMLSCTNNMMRFNKRFLFNQTFGKRSFNKNTQIKIDGFVKHISPFKEKIKFSSVSFDMLNILPNTMYYIDPPYFNTEAGYNSYWSKKSEELLYDFIIKINNIGSSFMISGIIKDDGCDSNVLLRLLSDGFNSDILNFNYNKVSRSGNKEIKEIIIYNYNL